MVSPLPSAASAATFHHMISGATQGSTTSSESALTVDGARARGQTTAKPSTHIAASDASSVWPASPRLSLVPEGGAVDGSMLINSSGIVHGLLATGGASNAVRA